jgi:hypothetical protein
MMKSNHGIEEKGEIDEANWSVSSLVLRKDTVGIIIVGWFWVT